MTTDARPGLALRLTALAAALAALIAVVSGVSAGGSLHRVLAALALPPLLAIAVAAYAHRRLLLPARRGPHRPRNSTLSQALPGSPGLPPPRGLPDLTEHRSVGRDEPGPGGAIGSGAF